MKKPKILVVGSMNMDLMVYGVPKLPGYGESLACDAYDFFPGGKGSNQAFAVSKLGAQSSMVGCLGDDEYGRSLAANLEQAAVDTRFLVFDQAARTGLAIICVEKAGRYVSYCALGANMRLSGEAVERALDAEKFDMVMMQLEMPLETVYRTYELAAARGIPVFLDAGPPAPVDLGRLKGIFIISPNEAETAALVGFPVDTEEAALKAAKILYEKVSPKYVILKMGSRGAFLYDGKIAKLLPTFDVKAIDSTAAGDTFNAALGVALCGGVPMEDALVTAQAAASICVSRKGALPSIPTVAEVEAFLKERASRYPGSK